MTTAESRFHALVSSSRWSEVHRFVQSWFLKPLRPSDLLSADTFVATEDRLGRRLPLALKELHALIGSRPELTRGAREDLELVPPEKLALADGRLTIYRRRTGVIWAIAEENLATDDPEVFMIGSHGPERQSVGPLSRFAHAILVHTHVDFRPLKGSSALSWGSVTKFLHERVPPEFESLASPLPVVFWCFLCGPTHQLRYLGDDDVLVQIDDADSSVTVYVAVRTEAAWSRVDPAFRTTGGWGSVFKRGPRGAWKRVPR